MEAANDATVAQPVEAEPFIQPKSVSVAAMPDSSYMDANKNKVRVHLVATLHYPDGYSVDARKTIEIDISEHKARFQKEAMQLFKRHQDVESWL